MRRSPLLPLAILWSAAAAAGPAAYYHPDTVAEQSVRFAQSAEQAGGAFDRAQQEVGQLGRALEELEAGMGMLGDSAPEASRAWAEQTRKEGLAQFVSVQRFVDAIQTDYSGAFEAALKRALPKVSGGGGGGVAVCKPSGPRMGPGGGGGSRSCEGQDLSPALAKAIDADAELERALAEIMGRSWPSIALTPAPQPVVALTGTERWISASALVDTFLADRVSARTELLEDGQSELEDGIEAGDAAAIQKASAMKEAYLKGLGEDGAALRAAATEALARAAKKGSLPGGVGVCANPRALGGCPGDDISEAALPVLKADKKLVHALEAYLRAHPLPSEGSP